MIFPSKELTLITANENKEIFMFDPKTTAITHKYRDDTCVVPGFTYSPLSQQIIAPQISKSFISVWSWNGLETDLKISMSETLSVLHTSSDGHFLYGGSLTGIFDPTQETYTFGNFHAASSSKRNPSTLLKLELLSNGKTIT